MNALSSYTALLVILITSGLSLVANAAAVDSHGDATIFKSRSDLDQVALANVAPAADHLFILGSGIGNGGFTLQTDTATGIQLGLRAGGRFSSNALPNDGQGTYFASPGASPAGPSDPPGSERATWNFYLHVDLGADLAPLVPSGDVNAPGPLTGSNTVTSVVLEVDFDPSVSGTDFATVDVYQQAITYAGATDPLLIQDSQNLAFEFWPTFGAPPFDVHSAGVYTIRLRAMAGVTELAVTEIDVKVGQPDVTVVSFGVQGGLPTTETLGGTAVEPRDAITVETATLLMDDLPAAEDIDAIHVLPNGNILLSTTTTVNFGGGSFLRGDIVEFDGTTASLYFDESLINATVRDIDALSLLPNGNLLISTSATVEIYGTSFLNGDIIEVDTVGETAAPYLGLNEATIFTGANQDIDALHYDEDSGNVIISVKTTGSGTVGTFVYSDQAADAFELDLSSGVSGSLYLDGTGLYDGSTRQLDAIFVPEPSLVLQLVLGAGYLMTLARRRRC